jgi:5'-nucleotidase
LSSATVQPVTGGTVSIQLLAFNDFHGNLDPPTGSNGRIGSVDAGGIEYLSTHLARLKETNPNTLIVAAGDLVGASPMLSSLFHDEPTIEAVGAAGLDITSVGNHEFDEGWAELYRLQHGGCHPVDGCQDGTPFAGARFQYLAANVLVDPRKADREALTRIGWAMDGKKRTLLPPFVVKEMDGVKIGFIGLPLRATPNIVEPTGIRGLIFEPEADTVNKYTSVLKKQGVRAIVVLIHEGGLQTAGSDYNGCQGFTGAIVPIAQRISKDVDIIASAHSHAPYICSLGGKLVTSAASFGRLITDFDIQIDRKSGEVVAKSAHNVIVTRDVPKDPVQTAILERYRPFHSAIASKHVGTLAHDIARAPGPSGESALGDVVADAIFEAARDARGGAVLAMMNLGGIRSDLTHSRERNGGADGPKDVTFGDVFNVLPFQNQIVVRTMTGDMIRRVLEQQFENRASDVDVILQVSDGFTYSYDRSKPRGSRVDASSMRLHGRPVDLKMKYRVAMTDFLSTGGDNFTVFTESSDPVGLIQDAEALAAYIGRHSPIVPGPMDRITRAR